MELMMVKFDSLKDYELNIVNNAKYFTVFQKRGNRRTFNYKEKFDTLEEAMVNAEATFKEKPFYSAMIYAVSGPVSDTIVGAYDANGGKFYF